jgi:hypothetical protein
VFALLITLLATAAVTAGQSIPLATPAPVFAPPTPAGMGYYIMQGSHAIGAPYKSSSDCLKALAALKNSLQPGTSTLVCAHRLP